MKTKRAWEMVGQAVARTDVVRRVTGGAKYGGDLSLHNMLHGAILRSPHAHARILRIDTSAARSMPGVKAVITAQDLPAIGYGMSKDTADQFMLAHDKVRYVGEELAAVAAVDRRTAEAALEAIRVEHEVLPAVVDVEEAMKEGAPRLHESYENNIAFHQTLEYGDVDSAWDDCFYVREDTFRTNVQAHTALQPMSSLAYFDEADGSVEVWTPNQSPFAKRRALSNVLELPLGSVKMRKSEIGGAFGGRSEILPMEVCAAALSMKTGRPVRIDLTREEEFLATRLRHGMIFRLKTGVDREGHLLAKELHLHSDNGAYSATGLMAVMNVASLLLATFRIPNFRFDGYSVCTNTTIRGAMRGHGVPQMRYADGLQLDAIARQLSIDPLEIRLKNAVHSGDVTPYKSRITSCGLSECLVRVAGESDWKDRDERRRNMKGMGIGCAPCISAFHVGPRTVSAAFIKFEEDGGVTLLTGSVDNGQGNESTLSQIVCEELKLPLAIVRVVSADTEKTPQDQGSFSMATTFVTGNAVRLAAIDARQQLLAAASELLETDPGRLTLRRGRLESLDDPDTGMTVRDVVRKALLKGTTILGKGSYMPKLDNIYAKGRLEGQLTGAFTHGAVTVEVMVDPTTGEVTVIRVVAAHDIGFAINPAAVEGGMEGAVMMGIGMALSEDVAWDGGQVMNASFLNYRVPLATDVPEIECMLVETIDPDGPYGAKEASGQTVVSAVVEAIATAVYDATGIMFTELPITPDKVLKALRHKES